MGTGSILQRAKPVFSDMLVTHNFDEIWGINAPFSAVLDNMHGRWITEFNAGFLMIKPNRNEFERLLSEIGNTDKYDTSMSEQSFLNWQYKFNTNFVPYCYNANLAIWKHNRYIK